MHLKTTGKLIVVLIALAVTGLAKLPLEQRIASDLREARLLPRPLDLDTREKLGQTSFAIVLGGLRSLVAAMLNLKAHNHWEKQEWFELEKDYRTITTLQPRVRYYWETAAWHLAYNAYADYRDKPGVPAARARTLQRQFQKKGIAFLELGTENLPDDWRMWVALGNLLRDPHKERDLPGAAAAYAEALERDGVPERIRRLHLYTLAVIPGRTEDAWKAMQDVWAVESNRHFPSVRSLYFALQHARLPAAERLPLDAIYPDRPTALLDLSWHWNRRDEGLPMNGVREAIESLLREFPIPEKYDPLGAEPGRWGGFPPDLLQSR
ncbi:MAG: hypothetical protein HKN82_04835 [Akkermansiaceae bacterium]|nr:hypothetical protein [Akkermansiaceae bacterium]NNM28802.1 hypothetical protein [Akkermansiaceae bacterium]